MADPAILSLGPDFYDPVEPAEFPQCAAAFRQSALGRARRPRSAMRTGQRISAASSRCPATCRSRWRCAITATSSACTIPDIGDGRGFLFAQLRDDRRPAARPRHQGLRPDALQPPRRRPADAQGRRARGAGDRDARGAGRQHVEELRAVRDRRGAGARRRALADPLGGADPAQPRPYPDRHVPAARLLRRGRRHRRADPLLPRQSLLASRRRRRTPGRACSIWSAGATATLAASYLAAGFVHGVLNSDNINITGESFDYGPWRFTPDWDPEFTAAYFDHNGLYAFGRQPEAIHWDLAQLAGCLALIAEAPQLSDLLGGWRERFEAALVDGDARAARDRARGRDDDRALAAAIIRALATAAPADRSRLLRLARRARSRRRALCRRANSAILRRAAGRPRQPPRTPIGPIERPARCTSTRSRRSGRRSPKGTTGSRSRTRLKRSGGWAKQWSRMHRQALSEQERTRGGAATSDRARWSRHDPATGERGLVGRDWRCRGRGRRRARGLAGMGRAFGCLSHRGLRRFANVVRRKEAEFAELIARETGKPLWEAQDRGRRRHQQGRDFDRRLCRADAAAQARSGARQQGRGPPQAAWRAGGARPV